MKEIVDIMLKSICRRTLTQMNLKLTVDDSAKAFLVILRELVEYDDLINTV